MPENKNEDKFILQRLKRWKKNTWHINNQKLKIGNVNASIIEELEEIVENSVDNYINDYINKNKRKYKNKEELFNNIVLSKDINKIKKLDNDIMFELRNNYPISFDSLGIKKNFQNVLNLSINPGDTQKKGQDENSDVDKVNTFLELYSFNLYDNNLNEEDNIRKGNLDNKVLSTEINNIIDKYEINEKYIWRKYYNPNFEIFSDIKAVYPWAALNKKDKLEKYFEEILTKQNQKMIEKRENSKKDTKEYKRLNNKIKKQNINEDLKKLMDMYENEHNKYTENNPIVFFNDLFWIADSNQDDLVSILDKCNKDKMKDFVKKILNIYIEEYSLKLIVVTNVIVSEYIKDAIIENQNDKKNVDNECVFEYKYGGRIIPIIFSGYIANGMDKFSKARLKKDIKKYYELEYNV